MKKSILECSTKGSHDGRYFSALVARVEVNNEVAFIEDHYQLCKRFLGDNGELIAPATRKEAKGKRAVCFEVSGILIPGSYIDQYFGLLWYKYLKGNKNLEDILEKFDDYNDIFKSKGVCQADVVREYMNDKEGNKLSKEMRGKDLYNRCKPFIRILNKVDYVMFQDGSVVEAWQQLIGHQVNCQNVFNLGLAKQIKEFFPIVCDEYLKFSLSKDKSLMGKCQIVDSGKKVFGNIFGQYYYGRDGKRYTSYDDLKRGLISLKEYAVANSLQVALPNGIGCSLAGGDWKIVLEIIKEVFFDYYVTIYNYIPEKETKKDVVEQLSMLTMVNI